MNLINRFLDWVQEPFSDLCLGLLIIIGMITIFTIIALMICCIVPLIETVFNIGLR